MHGVLRQPLLDLLNKLADTIAQLSLSCTLIGNEARVDQWNRLEPLLKIFIGPDAISASRECLRQNQNVLINDSSFKSSNYSRCAAIAVLRAVLLSEKPLLPEVLTSVICSFSSLQLNLLLKKETGDFSLKVGERGLIDLDEFMQHLTPLLTAIAQKFPETRAYVVALLVKSAKVALTALERGPIESEHSITKAFVLLHGVVYSLGHCSLSQSFVSALSETFLLQLLPLITDESLSLALHSIRAHVSSHERGRTPKVENKRLPAVCKRPWDSLDILTLYQSVFVLACRFCYSFLLPDAQVDTNGLLTNSVVDTDGVWDALVEGNLPLVCTSQKLGDGKLWQTLSKLCWSVGWKNQLRSLVKREGGEEGSADPLAMLLPAVCRCGSLAALLAGRAESKVALRTLCCYLKPEQDIWTGCQKMQADLAVISFEFFSLSSAWNPSDAVNLSEWLKWYLIYPPAFLETASVELVNVLRLCASRMLSHCLKMANDEIFMRQTVKFMALGAQANNSEARYVYENGMTAICEIASSKFISLDTCRHIVSGLITRAEWRSFNVFLVDRLVDLVLTIGFDEPRVEIVEFLVKLYSSPPEIEHDWIKMHLASRMQLIASSFHNSQALTRAFFLAFYKQILDLVVYESLTLLSEEHINSRNSGAKFTAFELRHVTHLLAVLQLLCEQPVALFSEIFAFAAKPFSAKYFPEDSPFVREHTGPDVATVESVWLGMRDLWLILPVLGLNYKAAEWTVPEWSLFLKSIARRTAALTMTPDAQKLEVDLMSHCCLSKRVCELFTKKACKVLSFKAKLDVNLFFNASAMSPILPLYFLALYCVESFRISGGDEPLCMAPLLHYVTDERSYGQTYYPLLLSIVERLLDLLATTWRETGPVYVTENMELLVAHAGFRLPDVRAWCIKQSVRLFNLFPHLYFEKKLVYLTLDMLQWLTRINPGVLPIESLLYDRVAPLLPLWQNVTNEALRSEQIERFLINFMDAAAVESAIETMNLVQCYLLDLSLQKPTHFAQQTTFISLMSHLCGQPDRVKYLFESYNEENRFIGEIVALLGQNPSKIKIYNMCVAIKRDLAPFLGSANLADTDCIPLLYRGAALLFVQPDVDTELVHLLVRVPIRLFSSSVIEVAVDVWQWLISTHSKLEAPILSDLIGGWCESMARRVGIYAPAKGKINPFYKRMTYTPSQRPTVKMSEEGQPHLFLLQFAMDRLNVLSKRVDALLNNGTLLMFTELANSALRTPEHFNPSAQCRETLFTLFLFGMQVLKVLVEQNHVTSAILRYWIYRGALSWFEYGSEWAETGRVEEIRVLQKFRAAVISDLQASNAKSRSTISSGATGGNSSTGSFGNSYLKIMTGEDFTHAQTLILHLMENELSRLVAWHDPLDEKFPDKPDEFKMQSRPVTWEKLLPTAFKIAPRLTVEIARRAPELDSVLVRSFQNHFWIDLLPVLDCPPALNYLLDKNNVRLNNYELRFLLYWCPTTPVTGIALLTPEQKPHPWILQYALRVLDHYPAEQVFFYVPQLVQALRYDRFGYIERYILETAHSNALFAHQIIWNMNANMFRDEDAQMPDVLKPVLDRVINRIIGSLSGSDRTFYEREFEFFRQVTSISGKLKPYIRKSKAEKKKKIDEEMQLVQVNSGVYLPTNPESLVVDVDKNSGKPLQSHAKAPFMATFKIQMARPSSPPPAAASAAPSLLVNSAGESDCVADDYNEHDSLKPAVKPGDIASGSDSDGQWMSAIFKVGDDCRQDILALQLISMFKAVFSEVKLDMYVYPYRIVATAPGCGVIEVMPAATSRDMIGREKINNLFDYYVQEFGTVHSIAFQEARDNLVRSLAAYSVISYILQIKDRHNGNIMFDKKGHILHVDFGFLLDISPGGINFESSPFKLTTEMIQVLGGDVKSFWYRRFCQLVIQGYLAVRPYMQEFVQIVQLMVDSGLPCFKGESTLRKLRKRFLPGESEKSAARFMYNRIKEAHENKRTELYDEFQRFQNGIPY